jgi:predicted nuclease of restriction endonuclease-like RecB superfamily
MSEFKNNNTSTSTTNSTSLSSNTNTNANTNPNANTATSYKLPSDITLQHASKLAIVEDKPIMLDYWTSSLDKKALIGVRDTNEKLLVKSEDEYTSPISKFYKSANDYIIITENSIYIVSAEIPTRKIT